MSDGRARTNSAVMRIISMTDLQLTAVRSEPIRETVSRYEMRCGHSRGGSGRDTGGRWLTSFFIYMQK